MKQISLLILIGFAYVTSYGQLQDTLYSPPVIPYKEYSFYKYNPDLLLDILHYQYSDLWDIDGDSIKDTLEFKSNGGAHAYYNLKIWLSSTKEWISYPHFYSDTPYPTTVESLDELEEYYPQFVVQDFDNDGIEEIYLNLNHSFAPDALILKKYELTSTRLLIDFRENKLVVVDFKK